MSYSHSWGFRAGEASAVFARSDIATVPIPEYRAPGVSEADSEGLFIRREPNGLYVNPVLLKDRVTANQVVGLTRTSFYRTDEKWPGVRYGQTASKTASPRRNRGTALAALAPICARVCQ